MRMKIRAIHFALGLSIAFTAYAQDNHATNELRQAARSPAGPQAASSGDPNRVLLVLFSGFNSCEDTDFLKPVADRVVESLRPEKKVDVLRYCIEKQNGAIRVRLPGAQGYRPGQTDLRTALLELAERQKEYGDTVMLGHSWGAWSLLRAVEGMEKPKLSNPNAKGGPDATAYSDALHGGWEDGARDALTGKEQKLDPRSDEKKSEDEALGDNDAQSGYWAGYAEGYEQALENKAIEAVPPLKASLLVTLDPINGELGTGCNLGTLAIGSQVCREFPRNVNQQRVAERTGTWLNYYQTENAKLHSGPAEASNAAAQQKLSGNHGTLKQDPRLAEEVAAAAAARVASLRSP
jgi:hypothetical protein